MDYIQKIRDLLYSKKINQEEFAKLLGVTRTTVNNYLTEKNKIDVDLLIKISEVLEVPIIDFFIDNSTNDETINQKTKYGNNYHNKDQGKIHNEGTVNGNVNITNAQLKDLDVEIVKLNARVEMLTDKVLQKDRMIEEMRSMLEEKQKFLDQVITGKQRQIDQMREEKDKQLSIREEEIERIIEEKDKQIVLYKEMIELLKNK